jgi:hypothetical protein
MLGLKERFNFGSYGGDGSLFLSIGVAIGGMRFVGWGLDLLVLNRV